MSTTVELVSVVEQISTVTSALPAAINALEEAVKNGKMPEEDQVRVTAAVGALKGIFSSLAATLADATDGVDDPVPPTE